MKKPRWIVRLHPGDVAIVKEGPLAGEPVLIHKVTRYGPNAKIDDSYLVFRLKRGPVPSNKFVTIEGSNLELATEQYVRKLQSSIDEY